jgi:hypothetical protein
MSLPILPNSLLDTLASASARLISKEELARCIACHFLLHREARISAYSRGSEFAALCIPDASRDWPPACGLAATFRRLLTRITFAARTHRLEFAEPSLTKTLTPDVNLSRLYTGNWLTVNNITIKYREFVDKKIRHMLCMADIEEVKYASCAARRIRKVAVVLYE